MIGQLPPGSTIVIAILAIVFALLVVWIWFAFNALVAFLALVAFVVLVFVGAKLVRPREVE